MPFYAYINESTNVVRGLATLSDVVDRPNMIPLASLSDAELGWIYNGDGTFSPPPPIPELEKMIEITLIWSRMTDAEQDQLIVADESGNSNAKRFIAGLQVGGQVRKGRIYPIIEGVWGATRAQELLQDQQPEEVVWY